MTDVLRYSDIGQTKWTEPHDVRYLALTTLLPYLVWETDPQDRVRFVSSLSLEILQRHPSELIGELFNTLFEDRSWTLNAHLRRAGRVPTGEGALSPMHQARTVRGTPLYCRVEGRRCFNPSTGQLIGKIGIAEFQPQETMRRAVAGALADALAKGLLGVVLVDGQGTIRFANPVFLRAVGADETPAVGRRLSEYLQMPSPCTPTESGKGVWHRMQTAVKRDGIAHPLVAVFSVLRGERGCQLVILVDDQARHLAASLLNDAAGAEVVLYEYAESLLAGFDDLWKEVIGLLEGAAPAMDQTTTLHGAADPGPETGAELPNEVLTTLTGRQAQVLQLLACGHTNKEIGRELGISEATVKTHVRSLMDALGAGNRTSAAAIASRYFPPSS